MLRRFALLAIALLGCADFCVAAAADDPRVTPVVLAYRKVRPAVVNISSEKVVGVRFGLFGSDELDEIFPSPLLRRVPVESLGSGFVIHPDGYVVTNAHVVRQAEKITVTLADGTQHEARVISAETTSDLAVLKVDSPEGTSLPHLPLGRSDDLMVGETVIAIGNPLGYSNTVTTGVISAVDRTLSFRELEIRGLVQTDAPINPGNSGGPLLNVKGELIGVNTAIRADAQNIGFAIPVDRLAEELTSLLDFESLDRVVFGARVEQRHGELEDELRVIGVRPGTPADGRLKVADRIIELNGKRMRQMPDYACEMLRLRAGGNVHIKLIRGAEQISVDVPIVEKPRPDGKALTEAMFGMTLKPLTPQRARELNLRVDRGLLVVGVEVGSPAGRLGVEVKDVIFQVGRLYVTDLDSLGMILESVKAGDKVKIGLVRGDVRAWAPITAREPAKRSP